MKSFQEFLAEAPTPGASLYHKDIGFPKTYYAPMPGMALTYGHHAKQAALDDGLKTVPRHLPQTFQVIEAEMLHGKPIKWVVRFPSSVPSRDLVIVVMADGFVKTVWTNDVNDKHSTLRRHLYVDPKHAN